MRLFKKIYVTRKLRAKPVVCGRGINAPCIPLKLPAFERESTLLVHNVGKNYNVINFKESLYLPEKTAIAPAKRAVIVTTAYIAPTYPFKNFLTNIGERKKRRIEKIPKNPFSQKISS